jgi:hypothetical protein
VYTWALKVSSVISLVVPASLSRWLRKVSKKVFIDSFGFGFVNDEEFVL